MQWFHKHWKRTPRHVRKPFVFLFGFTIVGTGIVLIPLPGPGWAIVFLGFATLASEFEFAERIRDRLVHTLKMLIAFSLGVWHSVKRLFDKWMQT